MKPLRVTLSAIKRELLACRVRWTGYSLTGVARLVTLVRPNQRWYWDARRLSILLAKMMRMSRPGVLDPSLEARLLHRFLDALADRGRHFPIPTRTENIELLQEMAARPDGFVCCAAHVPFVKAFVPVLRQTLRPDAEMVAVAKYPNKDGCVEVWNEAPVRAIQAGGGVLLHTRSLLRRGGCLLLLTDKEQGEYISSNIFRFVGKIKSRVIMCFPHLLEDGTILLQVVQAPAPECKNEIEVRANLDFIAQMVRSILAGGELPERVRASVMPLAQVTVAERGREVDRIQLYSRKQLEARAKRLEQMLDAPAVRITDRAVYERRLAIMRQELEIRSKVHTRSEYGPDGRPLED